jgi:23S rRNA (adenine2503-C2)-methyltransferase
MNMLGYTHHQFVDAFRRQYGKGPHYSTPVYRQVMKHGQAPPEVMKLAGRTAGRMASELEISVGQLVKRETDNGVVKWVTRLTDGLEIESVVIPMYRRHTLCVSSQVGCRMGCRFCRTGEMGLLRNLSAVEIVGQVFLARHRLGFDIRNVVFMGMGEPLDNFDQVVQAIRVLEDQRGLDIARRYITVSTAGLPEAIDRLARLEPKPVNLALSLNAPTDAIRSRIMPVNRAFPMAKLKAALMRYPLAKKSALFVEYVLIRGVNDRREHAQALARYLSPLRVKLNLIPYNPAPGSDLKPPTADTYQRFHAWLVAENIFVRRRREKGGDIMAACGQLGGKPQPGESSDGVGLQPRLS